MTHVDDPERVAFYGDTFRNPHPPRMSDYDERERRLLRMLAWILGSGGSGRHTFDEFYAALWRELAVREELPELLRAVDAASRTRSTPSRLAAEIPLTLHAQYSRAEIVAALGSGTEVKPKVTQGGILWVPEAESDVFFVDLHKAERDYSPTTMYRDRKTFELGTRPFTFLGAVNYVDHRGERPVAFTWRLPEAMPEELFETARSVAGV